MFLNIFFVYFRLENEVQLLKEKIKAKEECGVWIFELPRWGRRHPLLLFFVFKYLYMFTFLFDKLNFSGHFQLFHVFCLSIHVYVNIDLPSYFCNAHFDVHWLSFSLPEAGNTQQKYNFNCFKVFSNRSVLGKNYYYLPAWRQWDVKKKCKDLHSDTSLHLHCNDVHEQTMGQTFYCIIRINSILYTLYNTNCAWQYKMCCIVFKKETQVMI